MSTALCDLSATALLAHYRARTASPVEVLTAVLRRIDAVNPRINAIATLNAEGALRAARASESRWMRGAPCGLLDGVPLTLKDSIPNLEVAIHSGTLAVEPGAAAPAEAPLAARLREHGAVVVATTTMPDWGMIAAGLSGRYGITRNPWDPSRNSGGSSAGSGAALACGFGALSVGTDIGGSLRIPAAFCGVCALKPSHGRVPLHAPAPWLVAGPMARNIADAALLLNVIALPDRRDDTSLPYSAVDYRAQLDDGVRGLRIGLLPEIGFGPAPDAQIRAALRAAGARLEDLGAIVDEAAPIFDTDPEPHFDRCVHVGSYLRFARLPPAEQRKVLPLIADWCRRNVAESPLELMTAMSEVGPIRRRVADAVAAFDYLLLPTLPVLPYAAELPWPPNHASAHNPYCFPFNIAEQPAAVFIAGFSSDGLPIGLQAVGRRGDDAGVLRVAASCERAAGLAAMPPGLPD